MLLAITTDDNNESQPPPAIDLDQASIKESASGGVHRSLIHSLTHFGHAVEHETRFVINDNSYPTSIDDFIDLEVSTRMAHPKVVVIVGLVWLAGAQWSTL